jgi:hypothetical protein
MLLQLLLVLTGSSVCAGFLQAVGPSYSSISFSKPAARSLRQTVCYAGASEMCSTTSPGHSMIDQLQEHLLKGYAGLPCNLANA